MVMSVQSVYTANTFSIFNHRIRKTIYVILDHKISLKCSNSQKCIVWVKMFDLSFMPKIIRILSKDHVPLRYFVL